MRLRSFRTFMIGIVICFCILIGFIILSKLTSETEVVPMTTTGRVIVDSEGSQEEQTEGYDITNK